MRARFAAAAATAAVLLSSCASAATTSARAVPGPHGTATFALPTGIVPTYIFPFTNAVLSNNVTLFEFTNLSWRPLYWFGKGTSPNINYAESMALPPVYSNGGRTVTITLNRKYTWPNGKPVTSRDVRFWMNLLFAEKQNYAGYNVGQIPDDLTSMSFPASTPYTFSLTFSKAYSHLFALYDELSAIIPIPQYAWDRTSASGPVGNYDLTNAGAQAVFNYLNAQSSQESTYASDRLWKAVDGPWVLQAFSPATGATTFVPNSKYTGPGKPTIARFEQVPFTSSTAEFDALRGGQLDYGYLPPEDSSQAGYFSSRGYKVVAWSDFGFNGIIPNYSNPVVGPLLKQLYIRQAMQLLINQPQISKDIYHGLAFPTYGPIPTVGAGSYISKALTVNPYPYSVAKATHLLASHGWTVTVHGTDVCSSPGTGSGQCGPGINKGTPLSFVEAVSTGSSPFLAEAEDIASSWSLVGIHVTIDLHSTGEIFSTFQPCSNGNAGCNWQLALTGMTGGTPTYSPEYLPDAASWFQLGGNNNINGYNDSTMNKLSHEVEVNSSLQVLQSLAQYTGKALPELWIPNYPYQLSVISPHLHGAVPQNPNLDVTPEFWRLTS